MGIVDYVENQVFEQGRQQGFQQGFEREFERGIQKSACEIARQMLYDGLDRALIRKFTCLSEKQLEELI
jgi:predicted transposase/invertase (TIGR01784 family)